MVWRLKKSAHVGSATLKRLMREDDSVVTKKVAGTEIAEVFNGFFRGDLDFEALWARIGGVVTAKVTAELKKRGSRSPKAAIDEFTRDEVVLSVQDKLWQLKDRPAGRFNAAKHRYGSAGIGSWLGRICHNEVVSHARKWRGVGRGDNAKPKCTIRTVEVEVFNSAVERCGNEKTPNPASEADPAELVSLVRQCLNQINPKTAEAIHYRFFTSLTDRDAADEIGVAPSTICKRVKQGLKELKPLLISRGVDAGSLFGGL